MSAPARLHFFVAREKPIAVILRRGPSKQVRMIKWNLRNDTFELGQWFKGRIYEQKCSLSPSGKYFSYFAAKHTTTQANSKVGEYWTAVSKPPYFTAVELWPTEDMYFGGGFFYSDQVLSMASHSKIWMDKINVTTLPWFNKSGYAPLNGIMGTEFKMRLESEGWEITQKWVSEYIEKRMTHVTHQAEIREKRVNARLSILLKRSRDSDGIHRSFYVKDKNGEHPLVGVDWVDGDHKGRLLVACQGKLFALPKNVPFESIEKMACLADFNDQTFEEVVAPYGV